MTERIKKLIEKVIPVCSSWIQKCEDGLLRFIDPNDGEEISAHYGATHIAAAFIVWGKLTDDEGVYKQGLSLLNSILIRWDYSRTLPSFHFDFNNFAISIVEPMVDQKTAALIRDVVCRTGDSNHYTINWLPMRWAVNRKRIEWTGDSRYESIIGICKQKIAEATNEDGGVEDRLPHGMSFNLQYDLATVAVLQYLRVNGEDIDLSKELGFLLRAVAPDGDINYQGRGTNQIFAWGLWVYLLASSGQTSYLENAIFYLESRVEGMLNHNSMMLNNWEGKEKYLWWDYHYASVYTAHFLLWLVLSYLHYEKSAISPFSNSSISTGMHIHHSTNFFVSWFDGRNEYLAEKGPSIACIWTKKQGMICKGDFAPWQGPFGNKYIYEDVTFKNYCGLLKVKRNKDWTKNRYVHRLIPNLESEVSCSFQPLFCQISVEEKDDKLEISWCYDGKSDIVFNLPSYSEDCDVRLFADGNEIPLFCTSAIKNQYGWCYLHQCRSLKANKIRLVFK